MNGESSSAQKIEPRLPPGSNWARDVSCWPAYFRWCSCLAAWALTLLVAWLFWLSESRAEARLADEERALLSAQLSAPEFAEQAGGREHHERMLAEMRLWQRRMFGDAGVSGLLSMVQCAAATSEMVMQRIKPLQHAGVESNAFAQPLGVEIKAAGALPWISSFFAALGRSEALLKLEDFSLRNAGGDRLSLRAEIWGRRLGAVGAHGLKGLQPALCASAPAPVVSHSQGYRIVAHITRGEKNWHGMQSDDGTIYLLPIDAPLSPATSTARAGQ